jgi:protoporphyrinogen oxidase
MHRNEPSTLTILGGGPAGLGAGFYATRAGIDVQIFEANDHVGGNSRTLSLGPYRFDTGAHRLHDKDPRVTSDLKELLGDDLRKIQVPSQIYWEGSMIDFPLSPYDLVTKLDLETLFRIIGENTARMWRKPADPAHFEEMVRQAYGPTLAGMFLLNYSEKLWGRPTDELSLAVAGGRLKGLDLKTFFMEAFLGKYAKTRHLDGSFYYPRRGFGTIFEAVADAIGRNQIHSQTPVQKILHDGRRITGIHVAGCPEITPGQVISTLPLTLMIRMLKPRPPKNLREMARTITFRHLRLLVFALDRPLLSRNASIYFPSENFRFTRIYEPKNRSPEMAPEGKTAIVVELPAFPQDAAWQMDDHELRNEILDSLTSIGMLRSREVERWQSHRLSYAYPVLDTEYTHTVEQLIDYLGSFENMEILGRSAQFEYTHTHDLFAAAHETIGRITG